MAARRDIRKQVVLSVEHIRRLKKIAKSDPKYIRNDRPSESAVVREALDMFFLAHESAKADRKDGPSPAIVDASPDALEPFPGANGSTTIGTPNPDESYAELLGSPIAEPAA
jgi:hypothetical protein